LCSGSDVALFNQLFVQLYEGGLVDTDFLANTHGFDEMLERACASDLTVTGLDPLDVAESLRMCRMRARSFVAASALA